MNWFKKSLTVLLATITLFGTGISTPIVAEDGDTKGETAQVTETTPAPTASATATATVEPTATPAPTATATVEATPVATAEPASVSIQGSYEYNGVTVDVNAPEGAFPAGTTLSIVPVESASIDNAVAGAIDNDKQLNGTVAFNISFFDANGNELQPAAGHNVDVNFGVSKSSTAVKDNTETVQVFHMEDANSVAEPVSSEVSVQDADKTDVSVKADKFSIYVIGTAEKNRRTYNFYNGNTLVDSQIVKKGDELKEPQIPTSSDGNKFLGWSADNGATFQTFGTFSDTVSTDGEVVKLYAVFARVYYVTFYDQYDKVVKVSDVANNTIVNTTANDVSVDVAADEAFIGWTTIKGSETTVDSLTINNSDVQLYPVIKKVKWVSFDGNGDGSSYTAPEYAISGNKVTKPADPTRSGYTFAGWYTASKDGEKFNFDTTSVTADMKLYAHWTVTTATYSVIFWKQQVSDAKDASNADKKYDYAESVTRSADTGSEANVTYSDTAKGYTGFHYNSDKQTNVTVAADGSSVLNVYYDRNLLTINFYVNGSLYDSFTGLYGSTLGANGDTYPTDTYSWYYYENGQVNYLTYLDAFLFEGLISGNTLNLYSDNLKSNTISHYLQNVDGSYSNTSANDTHGSYNAPFTFTNKYTGFTVAQYRVKNENGNWSTWKTASVNQTVNDRYGLQIRHSRNSYTLDFKDMKYASDSNNNIVETESVKYQASLSNYSSVTSTGSGAPDYMKFVGWYKDPELTEPFDFSQKMPANNLVAYAKWEPKEVTISFNSNGGSSIDDEKISAGDKVTMPTNPTRDGYTFVGWTRDGSAFNSDESVYYDTTLEAKWILSSTIKVVYDANGGTNAPTDSENYVDGTNATVLGESTPATGKLFLGWQLGERVYKPGEVFVVDAANAIKQDDNYTITLKALYGEPASKTTLTYDVNGGSGENYTVAPILENNSKITLKSAKELSFTREGYYFDGWNTKSDGTGVAYKPGAEVVIDNLSNNTLYANWQLLKELVITGASDSKVYTGSEQEITDFTTAGLVGGAVLSGVTYSAKGTNVGTYTGSFSGTPVIKVGDVDVTENYVITNTPGTLTITKASLALTNTGASDSKVYTGSEQEITDFTTAGLVGGAVLSGVTYSAKGTNVGTYTGSFSGTPVIKVGDVDVTENYVVTNTPGTLTITKAPAEQNAVTAENYDGTYDGVAHSILNVKAAQTGSTLYYTTEKPQSTVLFALFSLFGAEQEDTRTWSTTLPTWTDVTAAQTVYVKATNPNYEDSFTSATVTITKRNVTLTSGTATKVYDGTALTNDTVTISDQGFVAGQSVTYAFTGTQTEVGSSDNTFTYTTNDGTDANNYDIAIVTGTLTVTAAPVTPVTPDRPTTPTTDDRNARPSTPNTGDQTNAPMAAGGLAFSMLLAGLAFFFRRKYSD